MSLTPMHLRAPLSFLPWRILCSTGVVLAQNHLPGVTGRDIFGRFVQCQSVEPGGRMPSGKEALCLREFSCGVGVLVPRKKSQASY